MASSDYSSATDVFFSEVLNLSEGIVWKNPYKVLQFEQNVDLVKVEYYILSRQDRLTFEVVDQFDRSVLEAIGVPEEDIDLCLADSNYIPEILRAEAVKKQQEFYISTYVEKNDYYRMLNGLPNIDEPEDEFVFNTEYPDISGSDTPLHELDSVQLYMLEANGYLETVRAEHPDKKYLQFLTDKKVDVYKARQSEDFSILWMNGSSYTNLLEDFVDTYNESRGLMTTVFFQKSMMSDIYCGFFGMMILFQTILQLNRKYLETDLNRDFYDEESIKLIYDSYGVPLYETIPMEYHRKIVSNINTLLSHKGSTKVFYDLFDVFGLDAMTVASYNIMKIHKFDTNGVPIFAYNEDGTPIYEKMYDLAFGRVPLYNDPATSMQDPSNRDPYEMVVRNDPYWFDDEELRQKLYREEFNYMESKYLGISTQFKLMQIVYEKAYYLKMILDNRELLNTTTVYNNSIRSYVRLYDLIVYLCAIITRRYGYSGNIPTDLSSIGKVMGFNFIDDIVVVKEHISETDYLKDDADLITYLETMSIYDPISIKKVYDNLTALRNHIARKFTEAKTQEEYWAYYELYKMIMYSNYTEAAFTKSDMTVATSFEDMIRDCNQTLYTRYLTMDEKEWDKEISDCLYLIKNSCSSLNAIQYADNGTITTLIEYLFKLMEFFKSAKADLLGYEVVFSLVTSYDNVVKFLGYINLITEKQWDLNTIFEQQDEIWKLYEKGVHLYDLLIMMDYINRIEETEWIKSWLQLHYDYLHSTAENIRNLLTNHEFMEDVASKTKVKLPDDFAEQCDQVFELYSEVKEMYIYVVHSDFPNFHANLAQIVNECDIMIDLKQLQDDMITCLFFREPMPSANDLKDEANATYEASMVTDDTATMTDRLGRMLEIFPNLLRSSNEMSDKITEWQSLYKMLTTNHNFFENLKARAEVNSTQSIPESAQLHDTLVLKYEETFDD